MSTVLEKFVLFTCVQHTDHISQTKSHSFIIQHNHYKNLLKWKAIISLAYL